VRDILKLGPGYRDLLRHIEIAFLSEDGLSLLNEDFGIPPESVWQGAVELITLPPPPLFDSKIIWEFPEIFAESQGKQFSLLLRGSRDGFEAKEFHRRCDGHANTLTVILDTDGNIFGGFTPVKWKSHWAPKSKADDSLKSFLFTLRNPHNMPAKRFGLMVEMKHAAIDWHPDWLPCFGTDLSSRCDIAVCNDCNTSCWSRTSLGNSYINDTGLDGGIVFTGSEYFQVTEIEVFEIAA
jgi:hypothetical protein